MNCRKCNLTNTTNGILVINYQDCSSLMWENNVEFFPNEIINIWYIEGTLSAVKIDLITQDCEAYPIITPTPTSSPVTSPTPTPTPTPTNTETPTATPSPTPTLPELINPFLVGLDEYLSIGNDEYLMFVDPSPQVTTTPTPTATPTPSA